MKIIEGKQYLQPITYHGSGDMYSLSNGDGFVIINADKNELLANEKVKYLSWKITQE